MEASKQEDVEFMPMDDGTMEMGIMMEAIEQPV
jgi:hypothetical protein